MATTTLAHLVDDLRFNIGDWTVPYAYVDAVLLEALSAATRALSRKWRNRYRLTTAGTQVYRNTNRGFSEEEPPVIMNADERIFVVQATIILKKARMSDTIWDVGSWRDDEIAYSNIESSRGLRESIKMDQEELEVLLQGSLYGTDRQSLPGFRLPLNFREGYE